MFNSPLCVRAKNKPKSFTKVFVSKWIIVDVRDSDRLVSTKRTSNFIFVKFRLHNRKSYITLEFVSLVLLVYSFYEKGNQYIAGFLSSFFETCDRPDRSIFP
jgi:hypothetical protein